MKANTIFWEKRDGCVFKAGVFNRINSVYGICSDLFKLLHRTKLQVLDNMVFAVFGLHITPSVA